jgi:hypothetical protein
LLKTLTEEATVFTETDEKIVESGNVGEVAPTFAADADFPASLAHFFQEDNFRASFGPLSCHARGHQAGGSTTDNYSANSETRTHLEDTLP